MIKYSAVIILDLIYTIKRIRVKVLNMHCHCYTCYANYMLKDIRISEENEHKEKTWNRGETPPVYTGPVGRSADDDIQRPVCLSVCRETCRLFTINTSTICTRYQVKLAACCMTTNTYLLFASVFSFFFHTRIIFYLKLLIFALYSFNFAALGDRLVCLVVNLTVFRQ